MSFALYSDPELPRKRERPNPRRPDAAVRKAGVDHLREFIAGIEQPPKPDHTTDLRSWFARRDLSDVDGMNYLAEFGLCSDLCVWPDDVAPCDVVEIIRSEDLRR